MLHVRSEFDISILRIYLLSYTGNGKKWSLITLLTLEFDDYSKGAWRQGILNHKPLIVCYLPAFFQADSSKNNKAAHCEYSKHLVAIGTHWWQASIDLDSDVYYQTISHHLKCWYVLLRHMTSPEVNALSLNSTPWFISQIILFPCSSMCYNALRYRENMILVLKLLPNYILTAWTGRPVVII